jgi:predicted nucleic acid-binding protein
LTDFGRYEALNAMRRLVEPARLPRILAHFDEDRSSGLWEDASLSYARWLEIAEQLSEAYAWRFKTRALDTLHVAAAITLGRGHFLTFDAPQRRLAEAAGLAVEPLPAWEERPRTGHGRADPT